MSLSNVIFLVIRQPLLQSFPNYPCDGSFIPLAVFHQSVVLLSVERDGNLHGMGFFRGFSTRHGITPIYSIMDRERIPKRSGGSKAQDMNKDSGSLENQGFQSILSKISKGKGVKTMSPVDIIIFGALLFAICSLVWALADD